MSKIVVVVQDLILEDSLLTHRKHKQTSKAGTDTFASVAVNEGEGDSVVKAL